MSDLASIPPVGASDEAPSGLSPLRASLHRFAKNRLAVISIVLLAIIAVGCFFGPMLYPPDTDLGDFEFISAPIDLWSAHPFGTDDQGRDLLYRVLVGGRISLSLGFLAALVSVFISVAYGATAGYLGGRVDDIMMRAVDILLALPFIFLAILIQLVLRDSGLSFFGVALDGPEASVFAAVVLTLWLTPAVIARGQAVTLRNREFVEAARAGGMSQFQIITQHIMPNSVNVVIVYSSLLVLEAILTESFLSFLGLGVQPPAASWGSLIDDGAGKIDSDPRLLVLPGLFLAAVLFCLNYITDGLRDAFDPNER